MYQIFHCDSEYLVMLQAYSPQAPDPIQQDTWSWTWVPVREAPGFWTIQVSFSDKDKALSFAAPFEASTVFDEDGNFLPGLEFPKDPYRGGVHRDYPQWFDEDGDLTENLFRECQQACRTARASSLAAKLRWGNEMGKVSQGSYPCIYMWRYDT